MFDLFPVRLGAYGLITMAVFHLVFSLLQERGAAWLGKENGPLELAQVGCLLLAVAGMTLAIRWTPVGRAALVLTAAVTLYAAARESDQWFETMFFDDAYKWLVGLPAAIAVLWVAFLERGKLIKETLVISEKPAATLFTIGGIYLCFFCQMIDRPLFWGESGLSGEIGFQKSMVEECAELFAYMLIAFSGLEAMLWALQRRAHSLVTESHFVVAQSR